MDYNVSAFKEPRGVMRILHFIFSICAFATITGYSGYVILKCTKDYSINYDYPFVLTNSISENNCTISVFGDFSSDAKFFVATGVLAMLYSMGISIVYLSFDNIYKSNYQLPLFDFALTVILAILWLSSSAAWANGLSGLKYITDPQIIQSHTNCICKDITSSSFSSLNISVVLGFLNFFLWAADLWFLYKETVWFQGNRPQTTNSGLE